MKKNQHFFNQINDFTKELTKELISQIVLSEIVSRNILKINRLNILLLQIILPISSSLNLIIEQYPSVDDTVNVEPSGDQAKSFKLT